MGLEAQRKLWRPARVNRGGCGAIELPRPQFLARAEWDGSA